MHRCYFDDALQACLPASATRQIAAAAAVENSTTTFKIIGFSDINYSPLAEMWYDSLTVLGYTTHVLIALDSYAFKRFQAGNRRTAQCAERNPTDKVQTIWGLRLR